MSESYNPETRLFERLAVLEDEARQLVQRRNACDIPQERRVIDQQARYTEARIEHLKKRLRPRPQAIH